MHIVFVDNSIDFNGKSLNLKAIDSMQKNLIYFAEALAKKNNEVVVYNNTSKEELVSGVSWKNYSRVKQKRIKCDILIILQDPDLIENNIFSKLKYFWLVKPFIEDGHKNMLIKLLRDKYKILFENHNILDIMPYTFKLISKCHIRTGINEEFFKVKHLNFSSAYAFVTSHPKRGLDWLIDLWCTHIHDKVPWAELHIFSNLLNKNKLNKDIKISNLQLKLFSKKNTGILVKKPVPHNEFLKLLPIYRVHLNPSVKNDTQFTTILESQASGIPVVSRMNNSIYDYLYDNETGYITNNNIIFAQKTIEILTNNSLFSNLSKNSRLNTNIIIWNDIVRDFERNINENFIYR